MSCRIADLRQKEVINVCDGARLGFVCDVELDIRTGCISAIVVPGSMNFSFWKKEECVIPWCDIRRIGEEIILVEFDGSRFVNSSSVIKQKN